MYERPDRYVVIGSGATRQHGSHVGWEGRLPTDCGSCVPEDANTEESEASCSLGMRIYCKRLHCASGQRPGLWNLQLWPSLQSWQHLFESCGQHSGAVAGLPC